MTDNRFRFCPNCGLPDIKTLMNGRKWVCRECGFDLYNNVASAVGLVIQNGRGEILLEKRAKEPRSGFLAFPGGFCNPDETAEDAACRECLEETGVMPSKLRYLCSFPNTYKYRSIVYKTCDLFFTAELPDGFELKPQAGEVVSFVWYPIHSADDVLNCPLAFVSAQKTLLKWLEEK